MVRHLLLATALALTTAAFAQTPAGGIVGGGAPAPYSPAGAAPGTTPSGLGSAMAPGSAVMPALPQPSTGVTPPIGAATAGTIGDGRVGTLAGGSTSPAVNGQPGLSPTTGVSSTTPTTNPPPR